MRLLIDTNIFLEVLLNQRDAQEARDLLQKSDVHECVISDFALHSISVILVRYKAFSLLRRFLADTVLSGSVGVLVLMPNDLDQVIATAERFGLDFDDAYQYVVAERHNLAIVSFDADFDRTPRGRQRPATIP